MCSSEKLSPMLQIHTEQPIAQFEISLQQYWVLCLSNLPPVALDCLMLVHVEFLSPPYGSSLLFSSWSRSINRIGPDCCKVSLSHSATFSVPCARLGWRLKKWWMWEATRRQYYWRSFRFLSDVWKKLLRIYFKNLSSIFLTFHFFPPIISFHSIGLMLMTPDKICCALQKLRSLRK